MRKDTRLTPCMHIHLPGKPGNEATHRIFGMVHMLCLPLFTFSKVHNNTAPSKPQVQQSVESSTLMNGFGDMREGETCTEREAVPTV